MFSTNLGLPGDHIKKPATEEDELLRRLSAAGSCKIRFDI